MKKAGYHVVNEAVEYAKERYGRGVGSFVNGVLRRYMRETDALGDGESLAHSPQALTRSFPEWLVKRWRKRFGEEKTEKLLSIMNRTPEFALRVDLGKISRAEAAARLESAGIGTRNGLLLESVLYVSKLGPVLANELFKEGLVAVQDETSQLAGLAVDAKEGDCVLDACAGSGTKSRQIRQINGELMLVSMDKDRGRLRLNQDKRNLVAGDVRQSPFRGRLFDKILVDAPCSSLGIIRKHPEIKWRRSEGDPAIFGKAQLGLLKGAWENLKTGGSLVYSVCSFEPEETTEVIEGLRKDTQFLLENPLPFLFNKDYFLSFPHETDMDGFFIARLKKI